MTSMKIDNYDQTADLFTFTVNPISFDDSIETNFENRNIPFQRHHIFWGMGGINPKTLILSGYFAGTNKMTDYRLLAKHFTEAKIKKLYFETDKFYLGVGKNIKQTQTGGRTNFTDYVASFQTFLGILLGDTEKTSGTNAGNTITYVTSITGHYTGSGSVVITDGFSNTITATAGVFSGKPYWHYYLIKLIDAGSQVLYSEWGYFEVAATAGGTYTQAAVSHSPLAILKLDVGANISTVSVTNSDTIVKSFRDGWIA